MRFSERHGYKPVKAAIQVESVDDGLRNALWNVLKLAFWDTAQASSGIYTTYSLGDPANRNLADLCRGLWLHYFNRPLDTLPSDWDEVYKELREYFYSCKWFETYDFIEFVGANWGNEKTARTFREACNRMLEREVAGYRFVGGIVTPIVAEAEVASIQGALQTDEEAVSAHLSRALELLSDRIQPDYRNSVKESISAVEAAVRAHSGSPKGTLGELLNALENKAAIHPALKAAMSKLYGYTSDASGIRHALFEKDRASFADAKFMLVVCTAFINWLKEAPAISIAATIRE